MVDLKRKSKQNFDILVATLQEERIHESQGDCVLLAVRNSQRRNAGNVNTQLTI